MKAEINFFDEKITIDLPNTFENFQATISNKYDIGLADVHELIIKFKNNDDKLVRIQEACDYMHALFVANQLKIYNKSLEVHLEVSEQSKLYKQELLNSVNQAENDKNTDKQLKQTELAKSEKIDLEAILTETIQNNIESAKQVILESVIKTTVAAISKINPNSVTEHYGVTCDGCGQSPILMTRYKCTVCDNFDYCDACEENFAETHQHPFLKIRNPTNNPIKIKCHLKTNNNEKLVIKPAVHAFKEKIEKKYNQIKSDIKTALNFNENCDDEAKVYQVLVQEFKNTFELKNISDSKICTSLVQAKGDFDLALGYIFQE